MQNQQQGIASIYLFLGLLAALFLPGCASVSVTDVAEKKAVASRRPPPKIYVQNFSTEKAVFNVDREGGELKAFKVNLSNQLADDLTERISKHVAPAQRVGTRTPKGPGWLVKGRFIRVNQGSRALRMAIGLGAGGTKVETETLVYDLAKSTRTPFLRFRTTGGSNAEPGAIAGLDPIGAGLNLVMQAPRGLSEDTTRTARMIAATLSDYGARKGWIPEDKALSPKKLLPHPHHNRMASRP
jgi:hypothetical protein